MLFKEYPFQGKTEKIMLQNMKNIRNYFKTGNDFLDDLIDKMLIVNYEERISWNKYFKHSFFKNQGDNEKETKENLNFPRFNFFL